VRLKSEHRLEEMWVQDPRWNGITRPYTGKDVVRLRGTIQIEYTLACLGSQRLWDLLHTEPYVKALGALTGNQAVRAPSAFTYGSEWSRSQRRCEPRHASVYSI